MILPLHLLLLILAYLVAIYWLIPSRFEASRQLFLCASSLAVLFFLSPVIAVVATCYGSAVAGAGGLLRAKFVSPRTVRRTSWLCLLSLIVPEFLKADVATLWVMGTSAEPGAQVSQIAWLGIGFVAIRGFVSMREMAQSNGSNVLPALCNTLFFASYPAGPIGRAANFQKPDERLQMGSAMVAFMRLGWGVALVSIVAPWIGELRLSGSSDFASSWMNVYRGFVELYANFAGATNIAIATARFFGIVLPENFNAPLLSTSVAAFWQRWHLSFMDVIRTYFTAPIVRRTGNRKLALLVVFPMIGLWHHVTPQYVLWGVGHAAALIGYSEILKTRTYEQLKLRLGWLLAASGWIFTITYVSLLSAIANASSWTAAKQLMHSLLPGF